MARADPVSLSGPAGRLEGLLDPMEADGEPRAVAVVCHPHPKYHGTMRNKVTHMLGRTFARLRVPALRFNFRGVGESEGEYDHGRGELDDLRAAARWMRGRHPDAPLWLAGFSFGAWISIRAAADLDAAVLVSVAPPVQRFDLAGLEPPAGRWCILQGDADELVDCDAVVDWVNTLPPGPELVVLEGVDHFFHGKLTVLRDTLEGLFGGEAASDG